MRINEIISQIYNSDNADNINNDNEKLFSYSNKLKDSFEKLKDASNTAQTLENLTFSNNKLASLADSINGLQTEYTDPVTGEKEKSEAVVDSVQSNRLKSQLKSFAENYNKTLDLSEKNASEFSSDLSKIAITDDLKKFGLSKSENGDIIFSESEFEKNVKVNETRISDLQDGLKDIGNMNTDVNAVISDMAEETAEKYNETKDSLNNIRFEFNEEQQNIIQSNMNSLFDFNTIKNLASVLGIGRNINKLI